VGWGGRREETRERRGEGRRGERRTREGETTEKRGESTIPSKEETPKYLRTDQIGEPTGEEAQFICIVSS
jgi:hypothetical protein